MTNPAPARYTILDVTFELLQARGTNGVTIDAIAEAAGVRRQTICRWWPTKGAVMAEAMARGARVIVPARGRALRQLVSAAVHDEHVAEVLPQFTAQRRAALRALLERGVASGDVAVTADLGMLVDLAYGVLWYRLLIGHAPLDAGAARDLAAHLIAAGQAREGRQAGDQELGGPSGPA